MEKINEHTMKYEHYTPEAVILANGEYPSHPLPLQMLKNAEFVVNIVHNALRLIIV